TRFSRDWSSDVCSSDLGTLRAWDARTGQEFLVVPAAGSGTVAVARDGRVLVADAESSSAAMLDPRPRGEIGEILTCPGFVVGGRSEERRVGDAGRARQQ